MKKKRACFWEDLKDWKLPICMTFATILLQYRILIQSACDSSSHHCSLYIIKFRGSHPPAYALHTNLTALSRQVSTISLHFNNATAPSNAAQQTQPYHPSSSSFPARACASSFPVPCFSFRSSSSSSNSLRDLPPAPS